MHDAESERKEVATISRTNEHVDNKTSNEKGAERVHDVKERKGARAVEPVVRSDAALRRGIYTKSGGYAAER